MRFAILFFCNFINDRPVALVDANLEPQFQTKEGNCPGIKGDTTTDSGPEQSDTENVSTRENAPNTEP